MEFEYWRVTCDDCTIAQAYTDQETLDLWAALHARLTGHAVRTERVDGDPRDAGALSPGSVDPETEALLRPR